MKRSILLTQLLVLTAAFLFCDSAVKPQDGRGEEMKMELTSPAFDNGSNMPAKYTCDGEDLSPELVIKNIPSGAKSLALIVDDPDAPMKIWVHWVVYDIPPASKIEEGSIPGKQGMNDSHGLDWSGPCPPSGTHRYYFKLYALDKVLALPEGIDKKALEKAMEGHILDRAELMGLYKRGSSKPDS